LGVPYMFEDASKGLIRSVRLVSPIHGPTYCDSDTGTNEHRDFAVEDVLGGCPEGSGR
jgi:hypothetical protein